MTRATEVCAVLFIVTSLSLGYISTQRGKSLVEKQFVSPSVAQKTAPVTSTPKAETPAEVAPTSETPVATTSATS